MKNYFYTLTSTLLVASLLLFFACNKSSSSGGDAGIDNNHIPAEQKVTANLQGRVLDESGTPVQGATVVSGGVTMQTDVNGVFSFSKISMSSRFGFVKVSKPGYFTGSRSIITNGGASNYVSIQLIPKTLKGSVAASAGGTVRIKDGDSVALPAGGIVNAATEATYTGNVKVYASYLDPTATDLYKYMPGDLRGVGKNGKETALQSFGMLAVELEGDGGEKLQITQGKKATLTFAIPGSLQASAPETIPLWYFNDSTGRWVEEGTAVRIGNSYVGQVGHFSYWNCDAPAATVNFKVHLKDQHANALAYTYIQFHTETMGTRGGYTDSAGFAQGLIPAGQQMVMQVVTQCGTVMAGANVGPALADQDLGTVTVSVGALGAAGLTLKGKVVNCAGMMIDSGFVTVLVDNLNYAALVRKGEFVLPVDRCYSNSTLVKLTAYDYATSKQSTTAMVTATSGDVDAGVLTTCGVVADQFFTFSLRGQDYMLVTPPDTALYQPLSATSGLGLMVGAYRSVGNDSTTIILVMGQSNPVKGVGTFATQQILLDVPTGGPTLSYLGVNGILSITEYGQIGGYVAGSFSGQVRTYTDSVNWYPTSGTFRLKRTF